MHASSKHVSASADQGYRLKGVLCMGIIVTHDFESHFATEMCRVGDYFSPDTIVSQLDVTASAVAPRVGEVSPDYL